MIFKVPSTPTILGFPVKREVCGQQGLVQPHSPPWGLRCPGSASRIWAWQVGLLKAVPSANRRLVLDRWNAQGSVGVTIPGAV